jgi:hypothetical protein
LKVKIKWLSYFKRIGYMTYLQIRSIRHLKFIFNYTTLMNGLPSYYQGSKHKNNCYPKNAFIVCPIFIGFTAFAFIVLIASFFSGISINLLTNSFNCFSNNDRVIKRTRSFIFHIIGGIGALFVAFKLRINNSSGKAY